MTEQSRVILRADNIGYSKNNKAILQSVNLTVHENEIITLIGPNGAGKTTFLKIILGLIPPDTGSITSDASLVIGYVPQKLKIPETIPMTIASFIALTSKYSQNSMDNYLQEVGLNISINQSIHSLSGGEFQRLLMVRALLRNPSLLVLDEPAQGLDFAGEAHFYQLLEKIRTRFSCAILLVSHDLHLVMAATDRVVCLNSHVCCEGRPDLVKNDPEFSKLFGDRDISERFAIYHHEHDHFHLPDGEIQVQKKK